MERQYVPGNVYVLTVKHVVPVRLISTYQYRYGDVNKIWSEMSAENWPYVFLVVATML